jgi:hypothetical protein
VDPVSAMSEDSEGAVPRAVRARRSTSGKRKPSPAKAPAAAGLAFKDPRTGKLMRVPAGFAWSLFLFSGLLGVPLFARRLHLWGAVILGLWIADLLASLVVAGRVATVTQSLLFAAFLAVQLWLGFKGNEITARSCLERGWTVVDSDDAATKRLLVRWGLAG